MLDLFFRDAACLDLDTNTVRRCDVGVSNGIITLVREHQSDELVPAKHTVACSGYWLFPGFLDIHTHLFAHGSTFGLDADRLLTAGVTYTVDMGSAGWVNYPAFRMCDLAGKRIGRSAFLNLSPVGQPGKGISEPLNEEVISQDEMAKIIEQFPGEISGIKVRISRNIVGQLGLSPLKRAIELGDHFGLPVCVHTTDPPANTGEIAGLLRPGDIYSHMYHGQGQSILREDGSVEPEIHRAQKRGVYLEVGNGKKNFDFRVAERAIADGLKAAMQKTGTQQGGTPASGLAMMQQAGVKPRLNITQRLVDPVIVSSTTNKVKIAYFLKNAEYWIVVLDVTECEGKLKGIDGTAYFEADGVKYALKEVKEAKIPANAQEAMTWDASTVKQLNLVFEPVKVTADSQMELVLSTAKNGVRIKTHFRTNK